MRTLQLILVLLLVFIAFYSHASNECTPWFQQDRGSYCILPGGYEGRYYVRECANEDRVCRWRRTSDCEKVELCSEHNPNQLSVCGPWRLVRGNACPDKREKRWDRTCVVGGQVESVCSREQPAP